MSIHENIAGQLHHMKPEWLQPGHNVGMEVVGTFRLRVVVNARLFTLDFDGEAVTVVDAVIEYDEGSDTYNVERKFDGFEQETVTNVYCDDLGRMIFGSEAKEWTMPFGAVQVIGDDGTVIETVTF